MFCVLKFMEGILQVLWCLARRSDRGKADTGAAGDEIVGGIFLQGIADESNITDRGFRCEGEHGGTLFRRRDGQGPAAGQPQLHADAGQAGIQLRLLREGAGRQQGAAANMGRGSPQGVLLPAGAEQQTAARLEQ